MKMVKIRKIGLAIKNMFEETDVMSINKEKRSRMLRTLTQNVKSTKLQTLRKHHMNKCAICARKYMRSDFSEPIFSSECKATLDGPDCWAIGWVLYGSNQNDLESKKVEVE